jgi:hypothetical protein
MAKNPNQTELQGPKEPEKKTEAEATSPIGTLRDEKIHLRHARDEERCACGREAKARVTVTQMDQIEQVTCKQCLSEAKSHESEYESASHRHKNARRKVSDKQALQALSDEDESPELLGRGR